MAELNIEELNFDTQVEQLEPQEPVIEIEAVEETPAEPEKKKPGRPAKVQAEVTPIKEETIEPETPIKETSEEIQEETEESGLIVDIAKKLGYEFQEGEVYTDDEDGLLGFVQATADKMSDSKLNGWLESLPPVASEFFDYVTMLGEEANEESVKAFFTAVNPEVDYKSVDLKDESVQKSVMRTFLRQMDYNDEEIADAINDWEVGGLLEKQAKIASTKLAANQEKQRGALLEKEKVAKAQRDANAKQYWGKVKEIVDSGKVNNFNIPVSEKKGVYDYMASGQGNKELQEYLNDPFKRTELMIAIKNGFKLDKYVTQAATTKVANKLRDQLKGTSAKMKSGDGRGDELNLNIDFGTNVGA